MGKIINIAKGCGFLQEATKTILQDLSFAADDAALCKMGDVKIFCTSGKIAALMQKQFFTSGNLILPQVYSIGQLDEITLAKIFSLNISSLTGGSGFKLINDEEFKLLSYNLAKVHLAKDIYAIKGNDVSYDLSKDNADSFTSLPEICDFVSTAQTVFNATDNNLDIVSQIAKARQILQSSVLNARLEASLAIVIKLGNLLGAFLQNNRLETKSQKRRKITELFTSILQDKDANHEQQNIYFVGQNGENPHFNSIAIAAFNSGYNVKFITSGLEDALISHLKNTNNTLPQFSKALQFCKELNLQEQDIVFKNGTSPTGFTLKCAEAASLAEQNLAIAQIAVQNIDKKVLVLTHSLTTARQLEISILRQAAKQGVDNLGIYNSFGVNLGDTCQSKLINHLYNCLFDFTSQNLLQLLSSTALASSIFDKSLIKELASLVRNNIELKNAKSLSAFVRQLNFLQHRSVQSLAAIETMFNDIKEHESTFTEGVKLVFSTLAKLVAKPLTPEGGEDMVQFNSFFNDRLTLLNPLTACSGSLAKVKMQEVLFIVKWLAKDWVFVRQSALRQQANIAILSLKEARYHSFDLVIIAGFNEGAFEGQSSNPLLSEAIKHHLGLKTQSDNYKNTAASFKDILSCGCNVAIAFYYKQKSITDRLSECCSIMDCFDFEGVSLDFAPQSSDKTRQPAQKLDVLQVPRRYKPMVISPTSLSLFLTSPEEFYLRHILSIKEQKTLDHYFEANVVGKVLHGALSKFTLHCSTLKGLGQGIGLGDAKDYFAKILQDEWRLLIRQKNHDYYILLQAALYIFNDLYNLIFSKILNGTHLAFSEEAKNLSLSYKTQSGFTIKAIPDLLMFNKQSKEAWIIDYKLSSQSKSFLNSLQMPLLNLVFQKTGFGILQISGQDCTLPHTLPHLVYYKIVKGAQSIQQQFVEQNQALTNFEEYLEDFLQNEYLS